MYRDDAELTRADVELEDRYRAVTDATGRMLVVDTENDDAWVRSNAAVDVETWA